MYSYETVTQAINGLRERGYTIDFNLRENCIECSTSKFLPHEFEITEIYRFEGDSDPGDEAIVYAIKAASGEKGVLVNAYGTYSDTLTADIAKKLSINQEE